MAESKKSFSDFLGDLNQKTQEEFGTPVDIVTGSLAEQEYIESKEKAVQEGKDLGKPLATAAVTKMVTSSNPLTATTATIADLHTAGRDSPIVQRYEENVSIPNLSLEPILPVTIPVGDMAKSFNKNALQAGAGLYNTASALSDALVSVLPTPPKGESPSWQYYPGAPK